MFSISLLTLSTIHIFKGLIKKMRYIYLIYLINYFCHFSIKVSFFFSFCFVNPTIFHFFNLQHHGKAYFKMSNESTVICSKKRGGRPPGTIWKDIQQGESVALSKFSATYKYCRVTWTCEDISKLK